MPPKGRTPNTPPRRRPKVAGLSQRDRSPRDGGAGERTVAEQWAEDDYTIDAAHAAPPEPAVAPPRRSAAASPVPDPTVAPTAAPSRDEGFDDAPGREDEPAGAGEPDNRDDEAAEDPVDAPADRPQAAADTPVADTVAGESAPATEDRPRVRPSPTKRTDRRARAAAAPDGTAHRATSRAGLRPGPSGGGARRAEAPARYAADSTATDGRRLAGVQLIVVLLLVALVCGAGAAFFRGQAARATPGSTDNRAVIDTAATSEVVGQVSKAIEVVLSYDFTKLDENERAAREVITGKYADEFTKTFADVRRTAPEQKLVLNTTVLLAGVTVLNDGRAEVIATMDLAAVRDTTPYNSPGRVKVVANKVDGRWKIAEMTLL